MANISAARVLDHETTRRGIHLVKSGQKTVQAASYGLDRSERMGLLPMAIAALAAPTVWCLYEVLVKLHF
jgi:hypothetical protein